MPAPPDPFQQFKRKLNSYAPITGDSFSRLLSIVSLRTIQKGEILLHPGQAARNFYFITKGILASFFFTEDGATHIKNFFVEGSLAGSKVSLLQSSPSAFSIQCLEEGLILEFSYSKYKQLIRDHADLKDFYIAYLEENWIIENEKRQIALATQTAREQYLNFLAEYPALEGRVHQMHIASYLGITPTQLSRIRKSLLPTDQQM